MLGSHYLSVADAFYFCEGLFGFLSAPLCSGLDFLSECCPECSAYATIHPITFLLIAPIFEEVTCAEMLDCGCTSPKRQLKLQTARGQENCLSEALGVIRHSFKNVFFVPLTFLKEEISLLLNFPLSFSRLKAFFG